MEAPPGVAGAEITGPLIEGDGGGEGCPAPDWLDPTEKVSLRKERLCELSLAASWTRGLSALAGETVSSSSPCARLGGGGGGGRSSSDEEDIVVANRSGTRANNSCPLEDSRTNAEHSRGTTNTPPQTTQHNKNNKKRAQTPRPPKSSTSQPFKSGGYGYAGATQFKRVYK